MMRGGALRPVMRWARWTRWALVALLVLALVGAAFGAGCRRGGGDGTPAPGGDRSGGAAMTTVTVYFSDSNGQYLLPESRQVKAQDSSPAGLAAAALNELVAGPKATGHVATIPAGAVLRGVKMEGDIAVVDFSRELQTKHWGGSTGEIMTVYSIVDTVTEITGIAAVRLLIEGQPIDSLVGHLDLTGPLQRDEALIQK